MSMSSIEMPACFLASGSVRTSVKIQSPYWPSVVQVFWPLTTQSSPSLTAVVRSPARSEPASGSEKPCDQKMSMLAVLGRNSFFCSSVPNCAMTGPIIPALNASGVGTQARSISSRQRWNWISVQSWPPHSTGQRGTASPAALSVRMLSTSWSLVSSRPAATVSRVSSEILVVKNSRISSRNARSSSVSSSCMVSSLSPALNQTEATGQYTPWSHRVVYAPPFTCRTCPVMWRAPSEARKKTVSAMSSTVPAWPSWVAAISRSRRSSLSRPWKKSVPAM